MAALVYEVTVIALTEFLSCIWLEALMFSFATITYLAISGGIRTKKCQHGKIQALSPGHNAKRAIAKGAGSQPQLGWGDLGPFFAFLRKGNLEDAVKLLLQLPAEQLKAVRSKAFPRLLATAAAAVDVNAAAAIVHGAIGPIEPQMLEIAVVEAQKCGNARLCGQLDGLALLLSVPKSQITLTALVRSYTGDDEALKTLLHQTNAPLTNAFAKALLQACAATKHVELVADIFDRVDPADAAFLRCYAEQVATCAMSADQVQTSIVQACISCSDWNTAKQQIFDARQNGVPVARANIAALIKSLLAADKLSFAGMLLKDSSDLGLQVSQASYHGMLHAHVIAGDHIAAWRLVADMRDAGFPPNQVSCSILLKLVSSQARAVDLSKVINLVNNMEVPADDVLLCSLTEACVRAGCWDLLSHITALPSGSSGNSTVRTLPVPLYGTMIKALGQAGEVDRVWALWGEMWSSGVEPTEITLGCMIESLVSNSETDAAWRLVQEIWQNEGRRHLVNTVTYSTLLKGFSAQPQKVEAMYMEMKERKIECNTITYNTILNHFAQSRAMRRVPQVLEDMRASTPPVEPDIVTYSTLIKGFCASGNLDRALGLQREMRADGKFMPDEIMYNSLLDGCAKEQRLSDALFLVEEMRKDHVRPSNYTLSMLVKLMGRCKKLGQAFSVFDQLTAEFGFRPNIQVYTCLMQACFQSRQPAKALSLLDRIVEDGLCPDEKAYVALVRGHLHMGLIDQAVELVQRSCQGASPAGVDYQCLEDVVAKLGTQSELVKALRAQVEEVWQHQQVRGRQATLPSLRYKTKTTVRGGKGNGTALCSGRDGGNCHVRSAAMAPKAGLAKLYKKAGS